tara:strand:- start:456 stop:788 length:333 start_codon:yes stop_codon:yes gene_type:complete
MSDPMGYESRGIHSVNLWGFGKVDLSGGAKGVDTTINIHLTSKDDPDRQGPAARLEFAFDTDTNQTLDQLEDEAFEIAAAFFRRLSALSAADLKAIQNRESKHAFLLEKD